MNDYVELFAVFTLIGDKWAVWLTETNPSVSSGSHVRRVRIPVPEDLRILQGPDAEVVPDA